MEKTIYQNEILAIDRGMLGEANYLTLHLIGRKPLKMPLDRIVWSFFPENDSMEERFSITLEIDDDDLQILYRISGCNVEIMDFVKAIGLTSDIFNDVKHQD